MTVRELTTQAERAESLSAVWSPPIEANQVHARTKNYEQVFEKRGVSRSTPRRLTLTLSCTPSTHQKETLPWAQPKTLSIRSQVLMASNLNAAYVPWLSNLGHLNTAIGDDSTTHELRELHRQLKGDERCSPRSGRAPILVSTLSANQNLIIEVDGRSFTAIGSPRFGAYPRRV